MASERLRLTTEEKAMLAGQEGPAVQKAMEIVTALGAIYGAEDLIPVESVQVAGVSYKNLGEAGLHFLHDWARQGARARVPAMLNPAGIDLTRWEALGIPEDFAHRQLEVIEAYREMGVTASCSCTPYLIGNVPRLGAHLAWSESSAVAFANSVLGARTNREGGPSALASAVCGRTARYGLHVAENRRATHVVRVRCPVCTEVDFGVLGYLVGKCVGDGIPYFVADGAWTADRVSAARHLRMLAAAMAASGAVALFHVQGLTPESELDGIIRDGAHEIVIESLHEGYQKLSSPLQKIDFVSIGCPHASLEEVSEIATYLSGRKVSTRLWVTTAQATRERAEAAGWVQVIERAGGHVVSDTCLVVAPVEALGVRNMATNSAKAAFYAPAHSGVHVRLGTMGQCLEAAVTGRWAPMRQQR
jgi:predicted aconitase